MNYLVARGWSPNSIAGMLGNMQTESTINPAIWQNLDSGNMNLGFGLVQWTPASKYINWANARGLDYRQMDSNLQRILWELSNNEQWISTSQYPFSFLDFTKSKESPEYLASAFLKNYERAGVERETDRRRQARHWYNVLNHDGGGVVGEKPFYPTDPSRPITSPYGWRIHPITNERTFHAGIDIGGGGQSYPIYATQSGIITVNTFSQTGGYMVYIEHTGDPYHSRYLHLASQSPLPIGTVVERGQQIGMMGNTGLSDGIHLHFEVALSQDGFGTESGTIDPELYLEMEFGGGGGDVSNKKSRLIKMLLADTLNGWNL